MHIPDRGFDGWIAYYLGVFCRCAVIVLIIYLIIRLILHFWNKHNGPKKPKL